MGCDIHTFTEKKPKRPATGTDKEVWINTDFFELNEYFRPGDEEDGESKYNLVEVCGGRNYNLFAVLANVRNNGSDYICDPRGIPDDSCQFIKDQFESWKWDGHSHSWFTLHELKEYRQKMKEQNITTKYSGYMSPEDAALVDKGEMPEMWWGGGNVKNQVYREWEHFDDVLKPMIDEMEQRKKHVFKYDRRPAEEIDKEFRIVFWFDN